MKKKRQTSAGSGLTSSRVSKAEQGRWIAGAWGTPAEQRDAGRDMSVHAPI